MSINVLDRITSSRIAAGEVIERPASALRELIDNAVDAGSNAVRSFIEDGGMKNITVIDDGCGMDRQDLEKCCHNHATSKIKTIEDIYSVGTMGFRGEALASMGACSCLTIETNGLSKTVNNGRENPVTVSGIRSGTCIKVNDLFSELPARRMFLKRPSTEAKECKKVVIEKALCFENTDISFTSDGELVFRFLKADRVTRALDVMSLESDFDRLSSLTMEAGSENVSLLAVSSSIKCFRRDRTQIRIIVNRRIIDNTALVHAVTNAFSSVLPGGSFPYFTLFIDDNPSLIDFNVHPAKRECRIRNSSELYSLVTSMIREYLLALSSKQADEIRQDDIPDLSDKMQAAECVCDNSETDANQFIHPGSRDCSKDILHFNPSWFKNANSILEKKPERLIRENKEKQRNYRYIGQIFNTYLLVEKGDSILIIDQHAAHERIIFNQLKNNRNVQELIFPYKFETEAETDAFLVKNSYIYQDYGITVLRNKPLEWEITSIPAVCRSSEEKIASYIRESTGDIEEIQKGLFAVIACHAAIKAGDILDNATACSLIDQVLELPQMTCPHGRNFVNAISRTELDKKVGRLI